MRRRLAFLLVVLAATVASYAVVVGVAPAPSPSGPANSSAVLPRGGGLTSPGARDEPGEYAEIATAIDIPPLAEFPYAWAEGRGCPHIRISRILGVEITANRGVRVLSVEPGKPAAKAGIQPGDRLGGPADCASSLYGSFAPGKELRTIEWTVRRPKTEARPQAAGDASDPSEPSRAEAGPR